MKKRAKNIISVIGVILTIIGIIISISSFVKENYLGLGISLIAVILGVIFLAIAFGD